MTAPVDQERPDSQLECRCCGRKELIEEDIWADEGTDVGDWQYVTGGNVVDFEGNSFYAKYSATCPLCIARVADGAVQTARESGLVECLHPDHGSHVPDSDSFAACRQEGYLPVSDGDYEAIIEAYHDAREWACLDCGAVEALTETTVEYHGLTLDGVVCSCGWTGRRPELSYRKSTNEDGDDR